MRVTNQMMTNSFLRNMNNNLSNLNKLNNQLTTGKEISKPSDNPFKTARIMQMYSDIAANKQYNENIKDTINWLDTTDVALEQLGNSFQRVRELMVSAGNASYGSDELKAIKDEINEKVNEVAQILNTNFDGKYIFGGTKSSSKPIGVNTVDGNNSLSFIDKSGNSTIDPVLLNQINSKLTVEISQGVNMNYNVGAGEILNFKDASGNDVDVMSLMSNIINNLQSGNVSDVVSGDLSNIDSVLSNINKLRGEVGAKQNRMDSAKTQNEVQNLSMTEILSKTEDIDLAEKTIQLATLQSVYMASLQTSAKILQSTLIDFVR